MEAATLDETTKSNRHVTVDPRVPERLIAPILDAVKLALATTGEQRLFRAGKLPGLFPSKVGISADAASAALGNGLLETIRTETKGKSVTEWVRATPAGVRFVAEHDSPKAVLRELRDVIGATRNGLPVFLDDARRGVADLAERFELQTAELVKRLDLLADRVEAALRRAEMSSSPVTESLAGVVPWADDALAHLDMRRESGSLPCPLGELFHAVRERHSELPLGDFHSGLRRLHDTRVIRLVPAKSDSRLSDPEYAILVDAQVCDHATR